MNIKDAIKASDLCQWEVAEQLNMSEFTLSRWLRRPEKLDRDIVLKIEKAINKLKKDRAQSQKEAN